ncbi:MAG: type II toxin-antitoxin system VapC family toxin [Kiritimatiellae bacterium]|nr:type II toxin-antitoxin system VapC family toxin [Kiritimatiellia bacterium]
MRIAIDTNRYRDFCAGVQEAVDCLAAADEIHVPFVTLAELRAGFQAGTLARKNENTLIRFLNRSRVHLLFPDEDTTHHYARIFTQLRAQGTPIPSNDMWTAALVIQHDLLLYSRDAHFDALSQVPRVD